MDPYDDPPISDFRVPLERFNDIAAQFSKLKKLRLRLYLDERHYWSSSTVVRLICTATNLRCLCLDVYQVEAEKRELTAYMTVLGDAKLPKLKSLLLANFDSSEAQRVTFLRHAKGLHHLGLFTHNFTKGSWERFAARTKTSLALKSVQLNDLYGNFDEDGEGDIEQFMNYWDTVEEFYLRNGRNPFSAEALKKYNTDLAQGK